tara:strand:+ start:356 stop:2233 length:1878 start_codon:yes stop_codon:yes gene_type:complete
MKYRAEIDGIRGISVIFVILYHIDINLFGGGFIGVDIFFVISGYLISNIIINDHAKQKFNLRNFYERRIRRILPALFLVYFASIIFSIILLYPNFLISFTKSLVSSLFFVSNFFFIYETGYFNTNASVQPLLHTWSLSIEEQFYLFFPLLFLFTIKRNLFTFSCIFLAIISFYCCYRLGFYFRNANFLFSVSRFWQIFVGVIICIFLKRNEIKFNIYLNNFFSALGLILIFYSLYRCNLNYFPKTSYPGIISIIPILGISLILISNEEKNFIFKILKFKFLVITGLISYSLYLWHQPIISFYKIFTDYKNYTFLQNKNIEIFLLILFIFFISFISWKVIEKPFRNFKTISSKLLYKLIFFSISIFIIFTLIVFNYKGFIELYDDESKKIININFVNKEAFIEKNFKKNLIEFDKNNKKNILIIGDSFAGDFLNILEEIKILDKINYSNWYIKNNCFEEILLIKSKSVICEIYKYNNDVKKIIENSDSIIFSFNWNDSNTSFLLKFLNEVKLNKENIYVVGPKNFNLSNINNGNKNYLYVQKLIEFIKNKNKFLKKHSELDYLNNKLISQKAKYNFINFVETYCNNDECRIFDDNFNLISYDGGHLTKKGVEYFSKNLKNINTINK